MTTLYNVLDSIKSDPTEETGLDADVRQVTDMIEVGDADLQNTITLTDVSMEHIRVAESIYVATESLTLGSKEYFSCLESHNAVVTILSKRMGVARMPAMEDIKNPYALKSSRQIALEGIGEFWRKSWEAVKKFFKEFFKKVMLFLRRIVNANLELGDYEVYNDQLVAKLKANNATIRDNSPVNTKLGQLLANEDQEKVDSDFILNQGLQKVRNLTSLIDQISNKGDTFFQLEKLNQIHDALTKQIKAHNYLGLGSKYNADIGNTVDVLMSMAGDIVGGIFKHPVMDAKSLPSDVYDKMFDDFDTTTIRSGEIEIHSLIPVDGYNTHLPRDMNLFVAHHDLKRFFVSGYKQEAKHTTPNVDPITQLSNLTRLQDSYKKNIKSVNLKGCTKSLEAAEDVIDKLLDFLSGDYVTLMEKAEGDESDSMDFFRLFIAELKETGYNGFTFEEAYGKTAEYKHVTRTTILEQDMTNIFGFVNMASLTEDNYRQLSRAYDNGIGRSAGVVHYIAKTLGIDIEELKSRKPSDDALSNYQKLQELNMYLSHVFSKLQIIYKTIVSDVFGMYTEIRYELVRYIYESARRYSY
ncbi:hypothetical protein [Flavobacterium sp.]|jgi:hypothetical protein|uniref:hypothetical protein n=1 Tax=Flavobacterium sp. TaxID=239 RepID=UPI0037C089D5